MKLSENGFSLLETVAAMGLALCITSLTAAAITQSFVKNVKTSQSTAGSLGEMELVQNLKSPKSLKALLGVEDNSKMRDCLQQYGSSCGNFNNKIVSADRLKAVGLSEYFGANANCEKLSQTCPFSREISYSLKCNSDTACHGVELLAKTHYHSFSTNKNVVTMTKEKRIFVPATEMESEASIDYSTCEGKVITGIDYKNKVALCEKEAQVASCDGFSVLGIGSKTCGEKETIKSDETCKLEVKPGGKGIILNYRATGELGTRIAYSCSSSGGSITNSANILYFTEQAKKTGIAELAYAGGNGKITCKADLKGEGKTPLATCSDSYTFKVLAETDSGGSTGSKNPSKSTAGKKTVPIKERVKLGSSQSKQVAGDGSSFSIKTKKKSYYTYIDKN